MNFTKLAFWSIIILTKTKTLIVMRSKRNSTNKKKLDYILFLLIGIFVLLVILTSAVFLSTRPTDISLADTDAIVQDYTEWPLDINREPITLYLAYGSNRSPELNDVQFNLSINGESLEIVEERMFDFYETDTETPFSCGFENSTRYQIDPELVINGSLIYGPSTANDPNSASGQDISNLENGFRGCLQVDLEITENAIPGEIVDIIFNQNPYGTLTTNDPEWTNPRTNISRFKISDGNNDPISDNNQTNSDGFNASDSFDFGSDDFNSSFDNINESPRTGGGNHSSLGEDQPHNTGTFPQRTPRSGGTPHTYNVIHIPRSSILFSQNRANPSQFGEEDLYISVFEPWYINPQDLVGSECIFSYKK
jgi:hypothetical protein